MDTLVTALPPGAAACAARRAPAPAARGGGPGPRGARGFTLIELVVTLTLVSVLAMVAVPLYEVTVTRNKESELRGALRDIRTALDAYKTAADTGIISKGLADSGYPPTLKTLVEGVDTIATPVNGGNAGVNSAATSGSLIPRGRSRPWVSRTAGGIWAKSCSIESMPKKASISSTSALVCGR